MKISEIKSDEVREEAVRLVIDRCFNEQEALNYNLKQAFSWRYSAQGFDFWADLEDGTTPNTRDMKLPEKNPSE
jgi:hypothetical protein